LHWRDIFSTKSYKKAWFYNVQGIRNKESSPKHNGDIKQNIW
jgi:hypothetical protein